MRLYSTPSETKDDIYSRKGQKEKEKESERRAELLKGSMSVESGCTDTNTTTSHMIVTHILTPPSNTVKIDPDTQLICGSSTCRTSSRRTTSSGIITERVTWTAALRSGET